MKERPILFSGPMVRALLAGTKTQTRRAFNPRSMKLMTAAASIGEVSNFIEAGKLSAHDLSYIAQFSPYGQPGDRLWVKETYAVHKHYDLRKPVNVPEGITIECRESPEGVTVLPGKQHRRIAEGERGRWRPSLFMRRWMSRLTLEIESIRVERLQDISSADCIAEGIDRSMRNDEPAKERYRQLWESINGPGSWDANPWVWVVSFKLKGEAGARVDAPKLAKDRRLSREGSGRRGHSANRK